MADEAVNRIVNLIHKRDPVLVISYVYSDFNQIISCLRKRNQNIKNFKLRFHAAALKMTAHGDITGLPEPFLALTLLQNYTMNDNAQISILAASVFDKRTIDLNIKMPVNAKISNMILLLHFSDREPRTSKMMNQKLPRTRAHYQPIEETPQKTISSKHKCNERLTSI